jgi:dihydrofolate reductase
MNSIRKYVVSSTLTDAEATWGPTTVLRGGGAAAEIAALKARPGDGNLLVEGSAQLVHTLARHGLVDEYRLMVFPVILGQGKRAFPDAMAAPAKLAITNSRTVGSGVLLLNLTPEKA